MTLITHYQFIVTIHLNSMTVTNALRKCAEFDAATLTVPLSHFSLSLSYSIKPIMNLVP